MPRIIQDDTELTQAVLAEAQRSPDLRFRRLLTAAVQHLHAFVRETELTEAEFRRICAEVAKLGQISSPSHNEVVLAAGSLGVSALVCLLNNSDGGGRETTANLMGPFWRHGSPDSTNGSSIVRSPTSGDPVFVRITVRDLDGSPVEGADVDTWQASSEGFYENQDPGQADMNLRGKFRTDADGSIWFRTVKPSGYPIPVNGPVGAMLRAQGRHNMRPAHLHFMVHKTGYKTQFSQVYSSDDPHLDNDVQFGVTGALVGHYVAHDAPPAPDADVQGRWFSLDHGLIIEPGDDTIPPAPITGKAEGERPRLVVLEESRVDRGTGAEQHR